jgi:hypothetical protein
LVQNILKKDISFPPFVSKELKSLIQALTNKDRTKRIGYAEGAAEIYRQPWLANARIINIKLPDELPFENIYLKQQIHDLEQGPRCLAEEYTQFEYTVDSCELYRKFANFSFSAKWT